MRLNIDNRTETIRPGSHDGGPARWLQRTIWRHQARFLLVLSALGPPVGVGCGGDGAPFTRNGDLSAHAGSSGVTSSGATSPGIGGQTLATGGGTANPNSGGSGGSGGGAMSSGGSSGAGLPQGLTDDGPPPPAHPACGVTLAQLDLYQGLRISIATDGQPVATRTIDIIQGRPALFRAHLRGAAGAVSARLTLTTQGIRKRFEATATITGGGTEGDLATTLNVDVPIGNAIWEGTELTFELLDPSGTCTGDSSGARFPATGAMPLPSRNTGRLKVTLLPMRVDGVVPTLDEKLVTALTRSAEASIPTSGVDIEVGAPIDGYSDTADPALDLSLDAVCAVHEASDFSSFHVGVYVERSWFSSARRVNGNMMLPAGTIAGQLAFPSCGSLTTYQADDPKGPYNAEAFTHELGHGLGLNHADCGRPAPETVDPSFPTRIGTWFFDRLNGRMRGPESYELMGYCHPDRVLGPYGYQRTIQQVTDLNHVRFADRVGDGVERYYDRWLVREDGTARRLSSRRAMSRRPQGEALDAELLDDAGTVLRNTTVYRWRMAESGATVLTVPAADSAWAAVRVPDVANVVLAADW